MLAKMSSKAYKLYAYMCYRIGISTSWQFNKSEILKHFTEGESAMRSAFDELIKNGFLERKRIRNDRGIFIKTDYIIYAEPVIIDSNPQVENPHVDNPQVGKPRVEKRLYNNKETKNKDSSNKDFISLPAEAKKEKLKSIWLEKKLKSNCEEYYNFRERKSPGWKSVNNLEEDIKWWENNYLKMNPTTKQILQVESKEIQNLRYQIKRLFLGTMEYEKYFDFAALERDGATFKIFVTDKKALEHQEKLKTINIKIEVKNG